MTVSCVLRRTAIMLTFSLKLLDHHLLLEMEHLGQWRAVTCASFVLIKTGTTLPRRLFLLKHVNFATFNVPFSQLRWRSCTFEDPLRRLSLLKSNLFSVNSLFASKVFTQSVFAVSFVVIECFSHFLRLFRLARGQFKTFRSGLLLVALSKLTLKENIFINALRHILSRVSDWCNYSALALPIIQCLTSEKNLFVLFKLVYVTFVPLMMVTLNSRSRVLMHVLQLRNRQWVSYWRFPISWSDRESVIGIRNVFHMDFLILLLCVILIAWYARLTNWLRGRNFFRRPSLLNGLHLLSVLNKLVSLPMRNGCMAFPAFNRWALVMSTWDLNVRFQRICHFSKLLGKHSRLNQYLFLFCWLVCKKLAEQLFLLFSSLCSFHVLVYNA